MRLVNAVRSGPLGARACRVSRLAATALLLGASITAHADTHSTESSWSVQAGPGFIDFREHATLSAGGARVPGGDVDVEDGATLLAEISYRFNGSWSVGVTLGIPPESEVKGAGTAAPFGKLGSVRYGPLAVVGRYTFNTDGAWHPYLGAGAVYYMILQEDDGFIANLEVDNRLGVAVQAGVRYDFTQRIGLFLDFKKLFVETEANGVLPALGFAPVHADVTLNPVAVQLGVAFDF